MSLSGRVNWRKPWISCKRRRESKEAREERVRRDEKEEGERLSREREERRSEPLPWAPARESGALPKSKSLLEKDGAKKRKRTLHST